jgi:GxxExxY protein
MHDGHDEPSPIPAGVERIGAAVMDAAFRLHRALGPGLLETAYEHCLAEELRAAGIHVEQQVPVPVVYGSVRLNVGYRIDLLVGGAVIVEVKSVDGLSPVHTAQVLTYLRFAERRLGYLINFNTVRLKDGFRRLVL